MRVYLGSGVLQSAVADFFAQEKTVGAICHGVLVAARSSIHPGKSVLYGKKTTALTKQTELIAWRLTHFCRGDYCRTYQTTVEDEVRSGAAGRDLPLRRDSAARLGVGFTVRDGHYLSARWPGDAHRFASNSRRLLADRICRPAEFLHQFIRAAFGIDPPSRLVGARVPLLA
jgi:protease I